MLEIKTFDGALEYIGDQIGKDGKAFLQALELADRICEDAQSYTGPQARIAAMKLAAYRLKIGLVAQAWKKISVDTKKPQDRLIKDALMCMYDGLAEVINTLKLTARFEGEVLGN